MQKLAIENMRGGRMSKIILEFENPFWKQGEGNMHFSWSRQVNLFRSKKNENTKKGRNTISVCF